jgi:hypothetical protein
MVAAASTTAWTARGYTAVFAVAQGDMDKGGPDLA